MPAYEIRAALPSDEDELLAVARHLNTVNLPHDRGRIRDLLGLSQKSFTEELAPARREYVFVLRELDTGRVIGTSMVIGQLGRRDAPYIFFDVLDEEKYSQSLDQHFHHKLLRIGYSFNGPTEIGGLILLPEYRRVPERLGQFLSYVRFLFIAAHRPCFRDEVLAELLPPLESDGTSHLWEALGRHFTHLSYAEADVLSKKNKEFIKQLFPDGVIYASIMSKDAQDAIGKVGAQTRGVEKMLRRIGFRYAHRVDPFDGGPHFTAMTAEITLVEGTRRSGVIEIVEPGMLKRKGLIAVETPGEPFFRSVLGGVEHPKSGGVMIERDVATHLGLGVGEEALSLLLDLFATDARLALFGPPQHSVGMAQPAPKSASLADLHALPPGVKGEIIEGVLHTQPRPRARHQRIAGAIFGDTRGPYDLGRGGPGGWWILVEPGIELPGSPEFSPDLAGWRREELPTLPEEDAIRLRPGWLCEVLSPGTRTYDTRTKKPFYARIGVPWIWYVDPEARTLTVSRLRDGLWVEVAVHGEDEVVRAEPFVDVEVRLGEWWGT